MAPFMTRVLDWRHHLLTRVLDWIKRSRPSEYQASWLRLQYSETLPGPATMLSLLSRDVPQTLSRISPLFPLCFCGVLRHSGFPQDKTYAIVTAESAHLLSVHLPTPLAKTHQSVISVWLFRLSRYHLHPSPIYSYSVSNNKHHIKLKDFHIKHSKSQFLGFLPWAVLLDAMLIPT